MCVAILNAAAPVFFSAVTRVAIHTSNVHLLENKKELFFLHPMCMFICLCEHQDQRTQRSAVCLRSDVYRKKYPMQTGVFDCVCFFFLSFPKPSYLLSSSRLRPSSFIFFLFFFFLLPCFHPQQPEIHRSLPRALFFFFSSLLLLSLLSAVCFWVIGIHSLI